MSDIFLAKQRLPLPALMHQLGIGEHAKKSALCPFHDDRRNSFSIWQYETGTWFWKCHAGCGEGDEITLLEMQKRISSSEATKLYFEMAGVKTTPRLKVKQTKQQALDWRACVEAFTQKHVKGLAQSRGYSIEFCSWLKQNGLVGLYNGYIAFPVRDRAGNVVAAHYRLKDGSWRYFPQGAKVRPFVIGELVAGEPVHVFESQWDAFAFMDVSGERRGIIITRGASNCAQVASLIPENSNVYVWTQNDAAGEKWEKNICANTKAVVKRAKIPATHKDLNDWTRAGATVSELLAAMKQAEIVRPKRSELQKKPSQADQLIKIAAGWEFFHTPDHRAFACVPLNGHMETIAVRSRKFRAFLIKTYHSGNGKSANSAAIEEAVAFFEGEALCGEELSVHTRLATHDGAIYLDLCNERWEAVQITADGWRVVSDPPVKFRRSRGMLALPTPTRGGSISDLRPFVNVANDDDFALLVADILAALRPDLPCPVEVLHGEQGSAKSTTAKVQKKLIDPAEPLLRSLPREGRDLYIAASNSWVVSLDNVSGLPVWLSDDLCRLATGGGFATRELYSDDEEKIFSALRPVILNGIEEIATRSDLLDRCILLELPMIPREKRRNEADFWREFEQTRPGILGALLDAVACGLRNLPTIRLQTCPRMADFATWIVACEPALGWPAGAFLQAYESNRSEANSVSLDASIIGESILEIANNGGFIGTASELLEKLNELVGDRVKKQTSLPKNGRAVSGQLKRIAPNLRAKSVTVNWPPRTSGARRIEIQKVGTDG